MQEKAKRLLDQADAVVEELAAIEREGTIAVASALGLSNPDGDGAWVVDIAFHFANGDLASVSDAIRSRFSLPSLEDLTSSTEFRRLAGAACTVLCVHNVLKL